MLIILQERDAITDPGMVDNIICCEIPPPASSIVHEDVEVQEKMREQAEKLRNIVLQNMLHGPFCGEKGFPCRFKDGVRQDRCSKMFPKVRVINHI